MLIRGRAREGRSSNYTACRAELRLQTARGRPHRNVAVKPDYKATSHLFWDSKRMSLVLRGRAVLKREGRRLHAFDFGG